MQMTLQKKATVVSSITAFMLIIIKLIVGFMTGTVVIIASAMDSALDFIVSLFNSFAVSKSQEPMDAQYNYGRGKIEGIASMFEGVIIILSGLFIIYSALQKLIHQEPTEQIGASLGVMIISMVMTAALVSYLTFVYKKTNSLIIKSDALHYKTDLYVNLGIIVALVLIYFTKLYFIDPLVSIAIAVYIIYSAIDVVRDGLNMLLDRALEYEMVESIKEIIQSHVDSSECIISGFHWLKTRQSGNVNFVDVHLVFNDRVLLKDSHTLADYIEDRIKELDSNAKWVINIHQDPYDDGLEKIKGFN
jgi:cation diffusion facilitator family transporter